MTLDTDITEAMDLSGQLANALHRMCMTDTEQGALDWNEMAILIHGIQARILAQVTARAFPDQFRRLGATLR